MMLEEALLATTREIYAEVASFETVPGEKIWRYWNVYTTTFRRRVDPTAFRLENFWWHVWSSDRRYLPGPVLARLFKEFATSPTFAPLRRPAKRHKVISTRGVASRADTKLGPEQETKQEPHEESSQEPKHREANESEIDSNSGVSPANEAPPSDGQHLTRRSGKSTLKSPTPSSTRPPPERTILKKNSGPSASGPRPTARFASPTGPNDEDMKGSSVSSGSTAVSSEPTPPQLAVRTKSSVVVEAAPEAPSPRPVSEMPPPPLPSQTERQEMIASVTPTPRTDVLPASSASGEKRHAARASADAPRRDMPPPPLPLPKGEKGARSTRKIVATTAASRRRPVMPMRRTSSQSSGGSDAGSRALASAVVSGALGHRPTHGSFHETRGSSSSEGSHSPGLSERALGKVVERSERPAMPARRPSQQSTSRGTPQQTSGQQDWPSPQRRSTWDTPYSVKELTMGVSTTSVQAPPPVAGFVRDQSPGGNRLLSMVRSLSGAGDPQTARDSNAARPVVAQSEATARGVMGVDGFTPVSAIPQARDIPDSVARASRPPPRTLGPRFTPTPPNPAPGMLFGRSMSQLTVLLERDKEREKAKAS